MKNKKKGVRALILVVLILILALGSGITYYLMERQKPQKAAEAFMKSIQTMNFDEMSKLIQTEDLSLLKGTDIQKEPFREFFQKMCQKLTYKIIKTRFDMTSGTAEVTIRINYIDGSEIYKQAGSEFLRQIAAASFSGKEMSDDEMNQVLADALIKYGDTVEDSYLVTEITYPMISINGEWKVVTLDNETIKAMTGNFSTVENELQASIESAGDNTSVSIDPSPAETDLIDMENSHFKLRFVQHRLSKDIAGNSCLLVYYEYTNKNSSVSSPMIDVILQAFQHDTSLEAAIPETSEEAIDAYMSEVPSMQTITVCQAFSLTDTSDVTIKVSDAFSFGDGKSTSQIIKIQ